MRGFPDNWPAPWRRADEEKTINEKTVVLKGKR
jgi:hypothetical protein